MSNRFYNSDTFTGELGFYLEFRMKTSNDFTFEKKLTGFAIKEPVFSFNKFPGVNKELGPEMKSTGEAIRFIKDLRDPYFRQLYKERSMHLSK